MLVVTRLPRSGRGLLEDSRVLLQALAIINAEALRQNPLPPLYRSGVRFQPEPAGRGFEDWSCPYDTFRRGHGDCDDLVIWRVAELLAGAVVPQESAAVQTMRKLNTKKFHARVRRANGAVEDPSVLLLPR